MTGPRTPVTGARLGVDLAVRALPSHADRERYYAEFVAELYGLPPGTQLRHVAGFLTQALALRAALGASPAPTEETAVYPTQSRTRRVLCHALRHHDWHTYSTEDGDRYESCTVCHRDRTGKVASGAFFGPFAGSGFGGGG